MSKIRWLVIPVLFLSLLGCGLISGIQQAGSQLPAMLTSMPTALKAMGTMASGQVPAANATPAAGRLNISLDDAKKVQQSGRFSFTDTTEGGQPVSTAVLTTTGGSVSPAIVKGFSARFIGDPANLSQILVTVPRTEDPATAFEEIGIIDDVLQSSLPPDALSTFFPWVTQSYSVVAQSGEQQQTTIMNLQFTMKSSNADITLAVDPAP